ncbi:MAG: hypothetical protein WCS37_17025, partial [Chloroflexota bacterium]
MEAITFFRLISALTLKPKALAWWLGLLQSPFLTSWVVGQDQLTATSWRSILQSWPKRKLIGRLNQ